VSPRSRYEDASVFGELSLNCLVYHYHTEYPHLWQVLGSCQWLSLAWLGRSLAGLASAMECIISLPVLRGLCTLPTRSCIFRRVSSENLARLIRKSFQDDSLHLPFLERGVWYHRIEQVVN